MVFQNTEYEGQTSPGTFDSTKFIHLTYESYIQTVTTKQRMYSQ